MPISEVSRAMVELCVENMQGMNALWGGESASPGGLVTGGLRTTIRARARLMLPLMLSLSQVVPEEVRAAVINLFRVPVNLFVCFMLFKSGDLPVGWMLLLCSLMVLLAAGIVGVLEDGESGATRLPTTA